MQIQPLETITRPELFDCAISPDGAAVAAVYQEGEGQWLGVWTTSGCRPLLSADLPGPYMRPRFSPDGRRLAASSGRGDELTVWSLDDGKQLMSRKVEGDKIIAHAFGPRGETVALAQGDRVSLWQVAGNTFIDTLPMPGDVDVLHASGDGRLLGVGLHAGGVLVVDVDARQEIARLPDIPQSVTALGFHPSQPWLLAATAPSFERAGSRWRRTEHGWAHVWNYYTGEEIARIVCDYHAALLGDGRYVATLTNNSRNLWVWRIVPDTDIVAHIENVVPELAVDEEGHEVRQATLSASARGNMLAVAGLTRPVSAAGVLRLFAVHAEAVPAQAGQT